MLLRSPSSLPISASVVAVKPLRAKHLAAAERIDATRGFSQSAERCWGFSPFSSAGLRTIGVLKTVSVVVVMLFNVPASRYSTLSRARDSGRPVGALSAAGFFAHIGPLVKPSVPRISLSPFSSSFSRLQPRQGGPRQHLLRSWAGYPRRA